MTFLPGKRGGGQSGEHRRDLGDDVSWLRGTHAVDAFVLLVEDHELDLLGVTDIGDVLSAHGIDLIRHPIRDGDVPFDRAAFRRTIDDIRLRLANGQHIAVACRGGLGRTGTVVGCLLREGGLDGNVAIALTRVTRHDTIETDAQERFVRAWGGR
jgi:protein-tyrosine phosphatase